VMVVPDIWNDPVEPYVPVRVDPDPSTLSVHETPLPVVYPEPYGMVMADPVRMTRGDVWSVTVTVLVTVDWYPSRSTFLYWI
jgi:hypothetical protein